MTGGHYAVSRMSKGGSTPYPCGRSLAISIFKHFLVSSVVWLQETSQFCQQAPDVQWSVSQYFYWGLLGTGVMRLDFILTMTTRRPLLTVANVQSLEFGSPGL